MNIVEKQPHSQKFLNERKLMTMIPVLVVPFLTMIFWTLDGGSQTLSPDRQKSSGFNASLPNADNLKDSTLDKMAFYDMARRDSLQRLSENRQDPYQIAGIDSGSGPLGDQGYLAGAFQDPNEQRVQQKLAALNASLTQNTQVSASSSGYQDDESPKRARSGTNEIDRLEALMGSAGGTGSSDPEMQQIGNMLNQILDIQHPDRVQAKLKADSEKNKGRVFPVSTQKQPDLISSLDKPSKPGTSAGNGFYSIEERAIEAKLQNAIEAVIHETQTVISGSIVKLRLLNEVYINGALIPKNTFVFGVASVNGERLIIEVNSLRYGQSIFPISLAVFDLDGLDGIYIPGAISREVSKSSADQALQGINMGASIDPSIGMQAMGAGLEAAKSLMSRKVKLVKVTVKAGYKVLLSDGSQQ